MNTLESRSGKRKWLCAGAITFIGIVAAAGFNWRLADITQEVSAPAEPILKVSDVDMGRELVITGTVSLTEKSDGTGADFAISELTDGVVYLDNGRSIDDSEVKVRIDVDSPTLFHRVLQIGQTVHFEMSDGLLAILSILNPEGFSYTMYSHQNTSFSESGEFIGIRHLRLVRYVGFFTVVPNQRFSLIDNNGEYRLTAELDPGSYKLRFFHPRCGGQTKMISVTDETTELTVDFEILARTVKWNNKDLWKDASEDTANDKMKND